MHMILIFHKFTAVVLYADVITFSLFGEQKNMIFYCSLNNSSGAPR